MGSDPPEVFAVVQEELAQLRVAQADGIRKDCVEHWLNIGRRAADHAQDVGRRGLALQSLHQFAPNSFVFLSRARFLATALSVGKAFAEPVVLRDQLGFRQASWRPRALRPHANSPISASACSSQNRMSISRYVA